MTEMKGIIIILFAGYTISNDCPDGWIDGIDDSMCYKSIIPGLNYTDSRIHCKEEGGHIIMPKTPEENTFLKDLIVKITNGIWISSWIGLTDIAEEGQWKWEDSEPMSYASWAKGEPNNHGLGEDCGGYYYYAENGCNDFHCNIISTITLCQRESSTFTFANETRYINSTGTLLAIAGFTYGDVLTYSCEPPYNKVKGNLARACTDNGTWGGMEPECKRITCTNETGHINSSGTLTEITGYEYNDTLTYSCEQPYYRLLRGNLRRTCTEERIWSGVEPLCERIFCSNETTHINSSGALINVTGYSYNDKLIYLECDPSKYKLIGGNLTRTCAGHDNWTGAEPVCNRCMCPCKKIRNSSTAKQFEEIVNKLKVDTKKTSKYIRKKTSAKDDRPSAKGIGYVGITVLVFVAVVVIVPDVPQIYRDIKHCLGNIKSLLVHRL